MVESNCADGTDAAFVSSTSGSGPGTTWREGYTTIAWGDCVNTFAVSLAINQALTESGVSIDSINYSWMYINGCFNTKNGNSTQWCDTNISNRVNTATGEVYGQYADQFDVLTVKVTVTDVNGNVVEEKTYTYEEWYHWFQENSHSAEEYYDEQTGLYWQIERDSIQFWNGMTREGTIYSNN